ncbi:MAG: RNA polymerase sigma factor [Bacteroidota bacterium]
MENSLCEEKNYRASYEEHAKRLRNFLYYKCGNLAQAEDLMHDAFIRLWKNCKKVLPNSVRSFLFTTANRLFLNTVEHEKVVLNFEKNTLPKNENNTPESVIREQEFKKRLEDAIAALPVSQREVFLLNRIEKISFDEIAEIQGVSVSAVHKKIYKALNKLKSSVKELQERKI